MPQALRDAGASVEVHADHFAADAPDEDWLAAAGQHNWIVITKDKAIRHRGNELAALKAAGVAAFVLTAKGLTGAQNGALLAAALPKLLHFVTGNRTPFIAAITAHGRIVMLYRGHKPRRRRRAAARPHGWS